MQNKDKFATAQEAWESFKKYCDAHQMCCKCKYSNFRKNTTINCVFRWVYDEADETPQWQENLMSKFTSKE